MIASFVHSVQSEWLKQRRSLAQWLVLAGGLFVPTILFVLRTRRSHLLPAMHASATFWTTLWTQSWNSMATVFLQMFIIVAVSLIIQLESRNNAWKQLHASPQPLPIIFFAKLTIIVMIVVELFVVFNVGIYLTGVLPSLFFKGVSYPAAPLPMGVFLERNLTFFVDSLPIVAIQYFLALRFKNVMVPIGAGMALWFVAIAAISWEYNYLLPYGYCAMSYVMESGEMARRSLPVRVPVLAFGCFVVFTAVGLAAYVTQKDRG
jgi:lantibiotic transport system permease protein